MTEPELIELGNTFTRTKEQYEKAVQAHIRAFAAKPLDDDNFFDLLGGLQSALQYRRLKDSKHGCEEFVRSMCFDRGRQYNNDMMSGWILVARFLGDYQRLVSRLHKKLWSLPGLERGDDGFGDLCDSLPLAGEAVITKVMDGDIANFRQLEAAIPDEAMRKFTLHGENYIRMFIEEFLVEKYAHVVARPPEVE